MLLVLVFLVFHEGQLQVLLVLVHEGHLQLLMIPVFHLLFHALIHEGQFSVKMYELLRVTKINLWLFMLIMLL